MPKTRPLPQEAFAEHLRSSVNSTEVQRQICDSSTCTVEWEEIGTDTIYYSEH